MDLADRLHLDGLYALQARDYDAAIKFLDASAKHNPDIPQLHNNRGLVLRKLGRTVDAEQAFETALSIAPTYAEAHYNLGVVLTEVAKPGCARRAFENAVKLAPEHLEASYALAELEVSEGHYNQAAFYLAECIRLDPADRLGASMLLAAIGHADLPAKAPDAFLDQLYVHRALGWDAQGGYEAPVALAKMVAREAVRDDLIVLDLGCGTGLLGDHIRPLSSRLVGVDRSEAMLRLAAAKGFYDALFRADMSGFVQDSTEQFDAITASALLIHFGSLDDVFRNVGSALGHDGMFVFSLYSYDNCTSASYGLHPELGLAKAGCFAHGSAYVAECAGRAGLRVSTIERATHEANASHAVAGLMVTVRPAA